MLRAVGLLLKVGAAARSAVSRNCVHLPRKALPIVVGENRQPFEGRIYKSDGRSVIDILLESNDRARVAVIGEIKNAVNRQVLRERI
jgi:hypothetical protein